MPYFKITLSGRGLDLPFDGTPVVGFFTTRLIRAKDQAAAECRAKELVLSEWQHGGAYALANRGSVPELMVEESFSVGFVTGVFRSKPSGYSFYSHEE